MPSLDQHVAVDPCAGKVRGVLVRLQELGESMPSQLVFVRLENPTSFQCRVRQYVVRDHGTPIASSSVPDLVIDSSTTIERSIRVLYEKPTSFEQLR